MSTDISALFQNFLINTQHTFKVLSANNNDNSNQYKLLNTKIHNLPEWAVEFESILSEINTELKLCKSTLDSIGSAYSMLSRKEAFSLSLEERDELKGSISLLLKQTETMINHAIMHWSQNFLGLDEVSDDATWDLFFKLNQNGHVLSLSIQETDIHLWLLAMGLQSLIVRHRSLSTFFAIADFLRSSRESMLNAPKLFCDSFCRAEPLKERKSSGQEPYKTPTARREPRHISSTITKVVSEALPSSISSMLAPILSTPKKYTTTLSSDLPEILSKEEDGLYPIPSSLTSSLALEGPVDVHMEELTHIQETQRQLEVIAALQSMLGEHLEVQSVAVDTIFDEAHLSLSHVGRGLDCLQQASSNPEGPFRIGAIFLLCLSVCLLLFDLAN